MHPNMHVAVLSSTTPTREGIGEAFASKREAKSVQKISHLNRLGPKCSGFTAAKTRVGFQSIRHRGEGVHVAGFSHFGFGSGCLSLGAPAVTASAMGASAWAGAWRSGLGKGSQAHPRPPRLTRKRLLLLATCEPASPSGSHVGQRGEK